MRPIHKRVFAAALLVGMSGALASPANAASYAFDVLYYGNSNASLATGSANPLTTALQAGDSFTYTLTGANGFYRTVAAGNVFPFTALAVGENGTRVSNFSLTLSYLGSTVFSFSDASAVNRSVHVGTNTILLPANLTFDTIRLSDTIVSSVDNNGDPIASTPTDILPIFGSPEVNQPGVVSYTVAAAPALPEPASWAMMIGGLGLVGAVLRRVGKSSTRVRFA